MTILVVTHALESAFRIADRIAMLHQGGLIAVGANEQFRAERPSAGSAVPGPSAGDDVQGDNSGGFMASYLRQVAHEH